MIRHLRHLHSAGIRAAEDSSNMFIGGEAAHGLEQQLIEALVECLSNGSVIEAACAIRGHQDVAVRFEALLQAQPAGELSMADICTMLGVSARTLCRSCTEHLGMGPGEYLRRRRLQQMHRA
jgi:AraC-like DNA-binding protein